MMLRVEPRSHGYFIKDCMMKLLYPILNMYITLPSSVNAEQFQRHRCKVHYAIDLFARGAISLSVRQAIRNVDG
ncbi:hypothetical protein TNCT_104071 [Trichonephila clavata]|uniref:Uncharacterized protein n=1 Tax=Trichonephila clavata TaxID=2740835 RepID=A0A8X6GKN8_TRICU|nr:hypothetical protein TNCT_104071 [Trichonephila clavata]